MQKEAYMRRALALAALAEGETSPNPLVGCVIVSSSGEIVGEGYHHRAGEAHAEINALRAAGEKARDATAYVTLEPCSHYGRTGPCCEALVRAGIARVEAACLDPNPLVAGRGMQYLRDAGVATACGLCGEEALRLNEIFFHWITQKRPFISLKYAMTLDGKIASRTGDSKWITGKEARTYAHALRRRHDAVLAGIGTVLADDPELTVRLVPGKNPLRIVLDAQLRIPPDARVLNDKAATLVVTAKEQLDVRKLALLRAMPQVQVLQLPSRDGRIELPRLLAELAAREITSVLVEGGSAVHGAFQDAGLADRVYAFIAPKLLGGSDALTAVGGRGSDGISGARQLDRLECLPLGRDVLLTGRMKEGTDACLPD